MKFLINNNTTYNYSYYATRPKWLIEAFTKGSLSSRRRSPSGKESSKSSTLKANFLHLKKSESIYKIAFAYQKPKSQKSNTKEANFTESLLGSSSSSTNNLQGKDEVKNQHAAFFTLKNKGKKKKASLPLGATKDAFQGAKNQEVASGKLKSKPIDSKRVKTNPKKTYQHLFQTKELLCWTSDLSFFNLRGYFSNILKVLQLCRFAVRNNKKILFVKGSSSSYGQGKQLNAWLVQYERNTVPQKLNSLFNESYLNPTQFLLSPQVFSLKENKGKNQKIKNLHFMHTLKNSFPKVSKAAYALDTLKKDKSLSLKKGQLECSSNWLKDRSTTETKLNNHTLSCYKRYYQLSGLLNWCLNKNVEEPDGYKMSHFKSSFVFSPQLKDQSAKKSKEPLKMSPRRDTKGAFSEAKEVYTKIKGDQKKTPLLLNPKEQKIDSSLGFKGLDYKSQRQNLKNYKKYLLPPKKKVKIKINNIIKLWIREAQAMSQQTAAGLTIPLAGFLTNSKTAFNTVCNLSNYDFYNSVNSNLKPNGFFNRSVCKIKANRLEKVYFQKNDHLSSQPSESNLQAPVTTEAKSKNKGINPTNFQINQEKRAKEQVKKKRVLVFNFPRVFESSKSATTTGIKGNSKKFTKRENSTFEFYQRPKTIGQGQKGWWIDYSNNHYYLPLTPNPGGDFFRPLCPLRKHVSGAKASLGPLENESITYNEKVKKQKLLEYCFFGDIFTWQSKSQKSSSMFYSNNPFNKNKDSAISYLKKQIILEKRGPIFFKREKNAPFFKHLKRQLQMFKNLKFQLKGPLSIPHRLKTKRQKKDYFLKKKQLLSTLGKFIVFYLKDRNIMLKSETKQTRKNQTYVELPSFPTIKTKVKIALGFLNSYKYDYKPTYGYNLALHTPGPFIFNQLDKNNIQGKSRGVQGKNQEYLFARNKAQRDQKGTKLFLNNFLINKLDKGSALLKPFASFGVKTKDKSQSPLGSSSTKGDNQRNKGKSPLRFLNKNQKSLKKQRLRTPLFYRYYKTIVALNYLNQYKTFAKTPFVSNQLADIIFFVNPEKNQNLVNQANCLKIPTVGIISGNTSNPQGHQGYNSFRLKESVYYPILGNPMSSFFTRAIIGLIIKFLRVEKSKNKSNQKL